MKNKRTKDEFIQLANELHKNKYDYSLINYINNTTKIEIICPEHGEFTITPKEHIRKERLTGCPVCTNRKLTTETFIEKSKQLYPNKFEYDKTKITNGNRTKVIITCKIHDDFEILVTNHYKGLGGCRKCASLDKMKLLSKTNEEFINQAKKIHKRKYDYSNTNYINAFTNVEIICKKHSSYFQKPNNHLNGSGCPKCAKEDNTFSKTGFINKAKGRECTFYILKCWNDTELFYKIGITVRTVQERYWGKMPYNYEIIQTITDTPNNIWTLENKLKKSLINKYEPKIKFNGSKTECYSEIHEILNSF